MDFGQPYVEIGWKMADDQLLYLALLGLRYVKLAASIYHSLSSTFIDNYHYSLELCI